MTPLHLRLPATSANLGPGFDALGLAMELFLEIDAEVAAGQNPASHIEATGRNANLVAALESNLILDTYTGLAPSAPPLHLKIANEIPLGMGCGSSAAALLAGVFLANHFGALALSPGHLLAEACRREGHPDNVAACFHGGLTASAMTESSTASTVTCAVIPPSANPPWRLILALPSATLATSEARALLPTHYSRQDAVHNIQATALLVSAFALNLPDLLLPGTADRIHQPYRSAACPLLSRLLPLAGTPGIFSVTLSGAGPSVLLLTDPAADLTTIHAAILEAAGDLNPELVTTRILPPSEAPAAGFQANPDTHLRL